MTTEKPEKKFEARITDGVIAVLLLLLAFLGKELWSNDTAHEKDLDVIRATIADIKNTDTLMRTEQLNVLRRMKNVESALRTKMDDRYRGSEATVDKAATNARIVDLTKRITRLEEDHADFKRQQKRKLSTVQGIP